MSLVVTLMAEWRDGPFWVSRDGGVANPYLVGEISEVLVFDDALLRDIGGWDAQFQATYRPEAPAGSGFSTEQEHQESSLAGEISHTASETRWTRPSPPSTPETEASGPRPSPRHQDDGERGEATWWKTGST